ncbi:MAG: hypothetical protein AAFV25_15145 [Bacteroidota bacterium]
MKTFKWISKASKFDEQKLTALMYNGVIKSTGKTPDQILNDTARTKIAGDRIGAAAAIAIKVIKAVAMVITLVKKVQSLFKKNAKDAGPINEANASDVRILEIDDIPDEGPTQTGGPGRNQSGGSSGRQRRPSPDPQSGSSASALLIPAALAAGALFLT